MPKVGKAEFNYDSEGIAAAKAEAARTGKPMVSGKSKKPKKVSKKRKPRGY